MNAIRHDYVWCWLLVRNSFRKSELTSPNNLFKMFYSKGSGYNIKLVKDILIIIDIQHDFLNQPKNQMIKHSPRKKFDSARQFHGEINQVMHISVLRKKVSSKNLVWVKNNALSRNWRACFIRTARQRLSGFQVECVNLHYILTVLG